MAVIGLEGLEFFSHHGVHAFEREEGGNFRVDVRISSDTKQAALSDSINDALDYERVYSLVKARMEVAVNLLETLSASIANDIVNEFPFIEWVEVEVSKLEPPVEGKCSRTYVLTRQTSH